MSTLKFKTNIQCENCLSTVKPYLENEAAIEQWEVDLQSQDKILTVNGQDISSQKIRDILQEAGFQGEPK